MTTIAVAAFMWGLVLILSLRVRARPDNSMFWAAVVIAASFTTNIDAVYLSIAELLPGSNSLDLVANVLLIIGVYYLSRAIGRGATQVGAAGRFRDRWIRTAAAATVGMMMVFFAMIDTPQPSTAFMLSYGDQLPAALYSMVQYTYIFAVMAGTLLTCVQNVPKMRQGRFKAGFSIIGAGCSLALLLCLTVVTMDIAHVVRAMGLVSMLGYVYDSLYALTIGTLCIGLGIPPLGRLRNALIFRRRALTVEPGVRRIWAVTVARDPTVSLVEANNIRIADSSADNLPESSTADGIHRMVVEIHDWLNFQGSGPKDLTLEDQQILDQAEQLCLHRAEIRQ